MNAQPVSEWDEEREVGLQVSGLKGASEQGDGHASPAPPQDPVMATYR